MTLDTAIVGKMYTVKALNLDDATKRRLEALGLTVGTHINVLNRNYGGAVILIVRGSRLAVGEKIAETIHLKEAS